MLSTVVVGSEGRERTRLVGYLRQAGHKVRLADTVSGARHILRYACRSMVFGFFTLPDGDVYDLLPESQNRAISHPLVFVHDFAESREAADVVARGAQEFLPTPLDPHEVTDCLNRLEEFPTDAVEADEDIRLEVCEGILVFHFPVAFTHAAACRLGELIKSSIPLPTSGVVLNFPDTERVVSSAIATLYVALDRYRSLQKRIYISGCRPQIDKTFAMAGIWNEFNAAPTMAEAIKTINDLTT